MVKTMPRGKREKERESEMSAVSGPIGKCLLKMLICELASVGLIFVDKPKE